MYISCSYEYVFIEIYHLTSFLFVPSMFLFSLFLSAFGLSIVYDLIFISNIGLLVITHSFPLHFDLRSRVTKMP